MSCTSWVDMGQHVWPKLYEMGIMADKDHEGPPNPGKKGPMNQKRQK